MRGRASHCGIFDASTLGKIEVVGPTRPTFMNRMYVKQLDELAVGRTRYGVLLREDGFILDDGVVDARPRDRFHVTTTTGGAASVLALMGRLSETECRILPYGFTSTTEHMGRHRGARPRSTRGPQASDQAHQSCARCLRTWGWRAA